MYSIPTMIEQLEVILKDYKDKDMSEWHLIVRLDDFKNFLKETNELCLYVVCDEEGKPMDKPVDNSKNHDEYCVFLSEQDLYSEAKNRVIFCDATGQPFDNEIALFHLENNPTIEDVARSKGVYLIESTAKELYLKKEYEEKLFE